MTQSNEKRVQVPSLTLSRVGEKRGLSVFFPRPGHLNKSKKHPKGQKQTPLNEVTAKSGDSRRQNQRLSKRVETCFQSSLIQCVRGGVRSRSARADLSGGRLDHMGARSLSHQARVSCTSRARTHLVLHRSSPRSPHVLLLCPRSLPLSSPDRCLCHGMSESGVTFLHGRGGSSEARRGFRL